MSERINEKRIEIKGRKFQINKMDALESLAILKELLTRAMPFDLTSIFGDEINKLIGSSSSVASVMNSKKDMSIDEFILFQRRLLKYAYEILPSGPVQVMNQYGEFGIIDADKDLTMVLKLLIEIVRFNYESFFIETLSTLGILKKMDSETPSPTA